jgi:D-beta-D-heptose 7-phosphate kinase / D-beta-D-heptose 1-phosphate adenosyltransferase
LSHVDDMIRIARQAGKFILVDPKGPDFARYAGADIITPNLKEFIEAVGGANCEKEIEQKAAHLRTACDIRHILLTRGEAGMTLLSSDGAPHSIAANAQEVFDVTGAGDTVIATMAAAIASGIPMEAAMQLANLAAGIVVSRKGTSSVTEQDIASRLVQENTAAVSHDPFAMIEAAKEAGATIVMTNGCFDILHAGHVSYLEQALKLGDHLVVAVNSDASVERLKGVGRPVHTLEHRMAVLKSLRCVSWVVAFNGSIGADGQHNDTPADCIRRVSPDILVKGGDYQEHEVAGAEHVRASGGRVVILPYVEGLSTTRIIDSTAK